MDTEVHSWWYGCVHICMVGDRDVLAIATGGGMDVCIYSCECRRISYSPQLVV